MRITAEAKEQTRQRILQAAGELFAAGGFEATTTREIAAAAEIAVGTLFNYFAGKERLGLAIFSEAVLDSHEAHRQRQGDRESLAESLFRLTAAELRCLEPYRACVAEVLEATGTHVLGAARGGDARLPHFPDDHIDLVTGEIRRRGLGSSLSAASTHLYLTLYLGILSFWSRDESTGQAQTLALLDQSTQLFARMLEERPSNSEVDHVPDPR